ncbi:MAG: dihydroorotate dehydrogenase electron transfer subunit [Phocaeicola sp.]|uniref:dihydroorotate dehydrogenase electron transfer subunit n=1 Tax=Phocaeicola TaxID=909656 RepID=UPI00234E7A63|nr:dihydroorotate dehydrogenase electron transfer subunit [Phocaeicola oris]MCE2616535.1 dihydroorotate dehydrogenase electron transfer subunit [Phocaeicola oris]
MKKYILDLVVTENTRLHDRCILLKLTCKEPLPLMLPGQFAELRVDNSPTTFLRRPISIHYVDRKKNEIWFLIQLVGDGTKKLATLKPGDSLNVILPLGNGFTILPNVKEEVPLLVGGGVGIAPLLMLGQEIVCQGGKPTFLLGARTLKDLFEMEQFMSLGELYITTEDGSYGEKGFATQHTILKQKRFSMIYSCGPRPMMVAVARYAKENGIECEVSLENKMACGLGACLCCVEDTNEGNVCVCKDGPVFNIKKLLWQI